MRIRLPGGDPTQTTLASDKPVEVADGVNLQLDTHRGELRCFVSQPEQSWLVVSHPEPRPDAQFDLDLRYFPAAQAASRKRKKRSAAVLGADGETEPPPKKKAKLSATAEPGAPAADTTPKKKRPPSTKPRKKATASGAGNGAGVAATQDGLSLLFDEIGPLDT